MTTCYHTYKLFCNLHVKVVRIVLYSVGLDVLNTALTHLIGTPSHQLDQLIEQHLHK